MELERVLTKLRYDESVRGYALFTNDGAPFLSFSLPDEIIPVIRGTMRIHSSSMKLMNVMTGEGIVILARVDKNWVLGVLFLSDESLGSALQKTQNVLELMEDVDLPPPPKVIEPIPSPPPEETATVAPPIPDSVEVSATKSTVPEELIPLETIEVRHGCIVHKGTRYPEAMRIDSTLYQEIKDNFANRAMDLLMMVDEKRTVFKIAQSLDRTVESAITIVKWCVSRHIVKVECPEEQSLGEKEIVELPIFDGDLKKVKKEHRAVIELCDGNRTLHEIADQLGILYFQALQCLVPYRGKSVQFIRKSK
ncbi:MAG: hypothetical protein ACFFED_18320 [Candidatus Thorarchaeota archaeon]